MSLSFGLREVDLTLRCKYCGHVRVKKGSWFLVAYRFKCEGCGREVSITYSDKVALFNKHANLSATQAEIEPSLIAPTIGRAQDRNRQKSDRQLQSTLARAPHLVGYAGRGGLRNQYR
jgi:DNA-directed RNA polymerase subunit RPC12/RpoP